MNRYHRIVAYLSSHPWAITREALDGIVELMHLRVEAGRLADDEIAARLAAARAQQGPRQAGAMAGVIPIYGVIMPRANLMTEMSGGTTIEALRRSFRTALADPDIDRIVFDVDSPGGSVEGVYELAEEIRAARGQKPMTSIADYLMASAAYMLGSQADEVVASPTAMVGSIGVYGVHEDWSGANEQMGVRPTYISAGKYKVEANPDAPLGDEALAHLQESIDYSYDQFVAVVAAARGASAKSVREGYGEGRLLDPGPALAAGLIDRIATFDEVLASKPPRMKSRPRAEGGELERVALAEPEQLPADPDPGAAADQATDPAFAFERERRARQAKRPITTAADSAGAFLRRR